ncbi:unnamed protein product [Linum trigynum]
MNPLLPVILLLLPCYTISQLPPEFFLESCPNDAGNYTDGSTYQRNLNTLLSSLTAANQTTTGFYNLSAGHPAGPDRVNLIGLCRGDVSLDDCRGCFANTTDRLLEDCPVQKQAFGRYHYNCQIRYSNRPVYGSLEPDPPSLYLRNINNASDPARFDDALGTLLTRLRDSAAGGSSVRKFATGTQRQGFVTIYGLVQCSPDLSRQLCDDCLIDLTNRLISGRIGGQIWQPSCHVGYEIFRFYAEAESPQPSPPLPDPGGGGRKNTSRSRIIAAIVIPIVIGAAVFGGFIFIIFCRRWRLKRSRIPNQSQRDASALSSLLMFCVWVGRWLWKVLRLLGDTYLKPEEDISRRYWDWDRHPKTKRTEPPARSHLGEHREGVNLAAQMSCLREIHRPAPERANCKRKETEPPESASAQSKKRRLRPIRGWRLWLPPPSAFMELAPGQDISKNKKSEPQVNCKIEEPLGVQRDCSAIPFVDQHRTACDTKDPCGDSMTPPAPGEGPLPVRGGFPPQNRTEPPRVPGPAAESAHDGPKIWRNSKNKKMKTNPDLLGFLHDFWGGRIRGYNRTSKSNREIKSSNPTLLGQMGGRLTRLGIYSVMPPVCRANSLSTFVSRCEDRACFGQERPRLQIQNPKQDTNRVPGMRINPCISWSSLSTEGDTSVSPLPLSNEIPSVASSNLRVFQYGANSLPPLPLQDPKMTRIANDQVVQFSLEEVQSMKFRASRTLLGRLFTNSNTNPADLKEALLVAWQIKGQLRVSITKHGLFEIVLPNTEARGWILKQTPWVVLDAILHLRPWTSTITLNTFAELAIAPFRVQLWNVREDCCTKQFGQKVAQGTIGQVLESGVFASNDTNEQFVKVRALIDFTKPLRSQIVAASEEIGNFWVNLKYEYLPTLCFHCGRVGHSKRACSFDPPAGQERFGPHMSTRKIGRRIYEQDDGHDNFRKNPPSVWVNRNVQTRREGDWPRPQAEDTKADRGMGRRGKQNPNREMDQAQNVPFVAGEQRARVVGSLDIKCPAQPLGRTKSPKQFSVKASPRVKIGGRQLRGSKSPRVSGRPLRGKMNARSRAKTSGRNTEKELRGIFEETRRRRLILQKDSEDEAAEQGLIGSRDPVPISQSGSIEPLPPVKDGELDAKAGERMARPTTEQQEKLDRSKMHLRHLAAGGDLGKTETVRRRLRRKSQQQRQADSEKILPPSKLLEKEEVELQEDADQDG